MRFPGDKGGSLDQWSQDDTNRLCDIIADGGTFDDCAAELPYTRRQCQDRFKTIRRGMGYQAC
jgi:hypothetical protein